MNFAIVSRIGSFQVGADGIKVGGSLRRRHARLEMAERHEYPARLPRVQVVSLMVHDGREEIGIEKDHGAVKLGRRHPDDGEGMLIQ